MRSDHTESGVEGQPISSTKRLLKVRNLSTTFRSTHGDIEAVNDVSFGLDRATTLGIVGETGSGKSVLIRSVMNLLRATTAQRSGQVVLNGRDITHLRAKEMRRIWGSEMSLIFQDPMTALHPLHRIGWQISEILRSHLGIGKRDALDRAAGLLDALGIADRQRLDQYPHELSGGMRQRIVIAIAIACDPLVVFADEPTTALDVTVQAQILDLLDRHQHERRMAMVLVSHDLAVVASRASRILVMYAGQVVESGTTSQVLNNPRMPYTAALLRSSPRLDSPRDQPLAVIPGGPPDPRHRAPGCRFAPRCALAQDRCRAESPDLIVDDTGRGVRCFFPLDQASDRPSLAVCRSEPAESGPISSLTVDR